MARSPIIWPKSYYYVTDYGAKGNGSINDTAAVQAAITAAQATVGGVVFFPIGTYLCNTGLTVTTSGVRFEGVSWDPASASTGSVIKAGGSMTSLVDVSSAADKFTMGNIALDGNALATNCLTSDGAYAQITGCLARKPATNGTGWNVTTNGIQNSFTDCRFNGVNQAGVNGWVINGADSTMTACRAQNCLDGVQYGAGGTGGQMVNCHHTPAATIGRCCVNVTDISSNLTFVGNRFDTHQLGSAIQISASASIVGVNITGNTFYPSVTTMTDVTFAAIGIDTTTGRVRQLVISGNIVRSVSAHRYAALLTAQTLAGAGATNPTRLASDGVIVSGNSVYAGAMYGTSSTPQVAHGNMISTDGTTWVESP